jgi:ABC-type transporter Mla MlaB component
MVQRTRIVIDTKQVHLLSVSGALDREGLRELKKHISALHDAGVRLIMADLFRVTSCDGRLFAVLAHSDHLLTGRGEWLRLVGLGPAVLDALDQATLPRFCSSTEPRTRRAVASASAPRAANPVGSHDVPGDADGAAAHLARTTPLHRSAPSPG